MKKLALAAGLAAAALAIGPVGTGWAVTGSGNGTTVVTVGPVTVTATGRATPNALLLCASVRALPTPVTPPAAASGGVLAVAVPGGLTALAGGTVITPGGGGSGGALAVVTNPLITVVATPAGPCCGADRAPGKADELQPVPGAAGGCGPAAEPAQALQR